MAVNAGRLKQPLHQKHSYDTLKCSIIRKLLMFCSMKHMCVTNLFLMRPMSPEHECLCLCILVLFQESLRKYSRIYDLSRSEQSKVRELAVTMAMDGQPLERIEQLLAVAVGTSDLSPKSIVQDAVELIITALRYSDLQFCLFLSTNVVFLISLSFSPCLFYTLACFS